jgi:hypothetical protein
MNCQSVSKITIISLSYVALTIVLLGMYYREEVTKNTFIRNTDEGPHSVNIGEIMLAYHILFMICILSFAKMMSILYKEMTGAESNEDTCYKQICGMLILGTLTGVFVVNIIIFVHSCENFGCFYLVTPLYILNLIFLFLQCVIVGIPICIAIIYILIWIYFADTTLYISISDWCQAIEERRQAAEQLVVQPVVQPLQQPLQQAVLQPIQQAVILNILPNYAPPTLPVINYVQAELPAFTEKKTNDLNTMCAVCLYPYTGEQDTTILPCNHKYHTNCINQYQQHDFACLNCEPDVILHFDQ